MKAVASPLASNEDLAALKALVESSAAATSCTARRAPRTRSCSRASPRWPGGGIWRPNGKGADLLGMKRVGGDDGPGGLEDVAGHDGVVIVLGDALPDQGADFASERALCASTSGTHSGPAAAAADFVLPVTTFAEQEGTFTNHEGRVQRFWPALTAPGAARPAWLILGALVAEGTGGDAPRAGRRGLRPAGGRRAGPSPASPTTTSERAGRW